VVLHFHFSLSFFSDSFITSITAITQATASISPWAKWPLSLHPFWGRSCSSGPALASAPRHWGQSGSWQRCQCGWKPIPFPIAPAKACRKARSLPGASGRRLPPLVPHCGWCMVHSPVPEREPHGSQWDPPVSWPIFILKKFSTETSWDDFSKWNIETSFTLRTQLAYPSQIKHWFNVDLGKHSI
jgi:hypothetical protein